MGTVFLLFLYFAIFLYIANCCWVITKKMGYSGWFGLLLIIPVVNLIILGVIAHGAWPVLRTRKQDRADKIKKLEKELAQAQRDQGVFLDN